MDEAGSENGGQPELTSDSPQVIELINFLDEFDERIEAHKRALCAHYPPRSPTARSADACSNPYAPCSTCARR